MLKRLFAAPPLDEARTILKGFLYLKIEEEPEKMLALRQPNSVK